MATNVYKMYVISNGNWQELEVDELDLSTTFAVEEVTDISKRKDSITKSIVLKGTRNNNRVLGSLYNLDRDVSSDVNVENLFYNYKPNKYLDCFVLENNIEVLRGKLLITDIEVSKGNIFYNCNIIGGVFSFFTNLQDKKLEDLDSLSKNLTYNSETIRDSWDNINRLIDDLANPNLLEDSRMLNYAFTPNDPAELPYYSTEDSETTKVYKFSKPEGSLAHMEISKVFNNRLEVKNRVMYTASFKVKGDVTLENGSPAYLTLYSATKYYGGVVKGYENINVSDFTTVFINIELYEDEGSTALIESVSLGVYGDDIEVKDLKFEQGSTYSTFSLSPADYKAYVFPFIDYGGSMGIDTSGTPETNTEYEFDRSWGRNPSTYRLDCYRPAIYVRSYIDAIFKGWRLGDNGKYTQLDEEGNPINLFKWRGSLKTDESFNKLIIPHNEAKFTGSEHISGTGLFKTNASSSPNYYITYNSGVLESTSPIILDSWSKDTNGGDSDISVTRETIGGNLQLRINLPSSGKYKVYFNGTVRTTPSALTIQAYSSFEFYKKTGDVLDKFTSLEYRPKGLMKKGDSWDLELKGEREFVTLDGGNSYIITALLPPFTTFKFENLRMSVEAAEDVTQDVGYGDDFDLVTTIPKDVNARDFLKDIMLLFNLFIVSDKESDNSFILMSYDEFYKDIINLNLDKAKDWTNKCDFDSYTIKSNVNLAKGYEFNYKEDKGYWNETYKKDSGETLGAFKILDSSGIVEPYKTEFMFSATLSPGYRNNSIRMPAIYEWGGSDYGEEKKQLKSNLRLLYFNGKVSYFEGYDLEDNLHNVISGTHFISYGNADMLDFNKYEGTDILNLSEFNNTLYFGEPYSLYDDDDSVKLLTNGSMRNRFQFAKYHQNRINELIDPNFVTVEMEMFLNQEDVGGLDFRTPVYIQTPYGSSYFKILKVEYYNSSEPSRVTLQKVVTPDIKFNY